MHSLHAFFLQFFVFHDISKPAYLPKSWISLKITNTVFSAMYKKMEDFVKIDVIRFGDDDTLVTLNQLGTRSFITHWSSQLYVHISALKKYIHEIPAALRTHHQDIVKGGIGFFGKVKLIG